MKKDGVRLSELGTKRVISTRSGEDMGRIRDVKIDPETGAVTAVAVVRKRGLRWIFGGEEYSVLWKDIGLVGEDTVLVSGEMQSDTSSGGKKKTFGLFE